MPVFLGFSGGPDSKESACNAGDLGSISGLGRSPGDGNGYPLNGYPSKAKYGKRVGRAYIIHTLEKPFLHIWRRGRWMKGNHIKNKRHCIEHRCQ